MDRNEYLDLIAPAMLLTVKKHEDYNNSIKLVEYFPFGHKSYVQMLHVKLMRLRSLAENAEPNFESVEDTVLDLINYAVFYLQFLRK